MPLNEIPQAVSLQYRTKGDTQTQWDVFSGQLRIGSIHKGSLSLSANRETPWAWHFALHVAPPGFEHHGFARTFEEAQAAVARSWQLWIDAAGLR
jgi:hypothetical protein